MQQSPDTLNRQWIMLQKIPSEPHRITVSDLKKHLMNEGYNVTARTIQRDLIKLSGKGMFTLISETEGRKNFWSWMRHSPIVQLPGMDPVTALAFQMTKSYLQPILPQATLEILTPYFTRATEILDSGQSALKAWPEKVAVIDKGPVLIKPNINPHIQNTLYQALLEEKQIKASYKKRYATTAANYILNPLAVVNKDGVIYLVCTLWSYTDIKQFALHRFTDAELLNEDINQPSGFNLQDYIETEHQFSYPLSSEPIKLKVLFTAASVEHLSETPLTENQTLSRQADGRILLAATVLDTEELRWWLSAFSSNAEVIEPIELKQYFINELNLMQAQYHKK